MTDSGDGTLIGDEEHIKWCFSKRNVKIGDPSDVVSNDYLKKSKEAIEVADLLLKNGYYSWSLTASYYAMYFALYSILPKMGVTSENHTCTISIARFLFSRRGHIREDVIDTVSESMENRVDKQYGTVPTEKGFAASELEKARKVLIELSSFRNALGKKMIEESRRELEGLLKWAR